VFGVTACDDDDPVTPEPEPEVATMRITAGAQTISVDGTGAVTGGPLAIPSGGAITISASFLRDDGTPDPLVTDADFRLEVTDPTIGSPPPSVATFARTGGFTGTLTATQDGSAPMLFALLHIDEGHEDFGPFPITITVAP
jgi:hypothetical protein